MMKATFVELDIGEIKALVPSMRVLPALEIMALYKESDSIKQFGLVSELLRNIISREFVENFDSLNIDEMVLVVTQWMEKSNEDSEGATE